MGVVAHNMNYFEILKVPVAYNIDIDLLTKNYFSLQQSVDQVDPAILNEAYNTLKKATDAKGRKLKIYKLCMPKVDVKLGANFKIDGVVGTKPRVEGENCVASYMNFLITNDGVICPQFGDENDLLALAQLKGIFQDKEVVGVKSKEVIYGGGNIHCITQQQPL